MNTRIRLALCGAVALDLALVLAIGSGLAGRGASLGAQASGSPLKAASSTGRYYITRIKPPAGDQFWPKAVNGGGDIAGQLTSHTTGWSRAYLYRHDGRPVDLGVPKGFTESTALGLSDQRAVLVQAWNTKRAMRFVAWPGHRRYRWERIHTGIPGWYPQDIQAIDGQGDLVGAVDRPGNKGSLRAAVWLPTTSGAYGHATILPGTDSGYISEASVVWATTLVNPLRSGRRRPKVIVVGGSEIQETTGNANTVAAIWTNAGGRGFRQANDTFNLVAGAIGGRLWGHLYLAGTTDTGSNYGEPIPQEASMVRFGKRGRATVPSEINLAVRMKDKPYLYAGVTGVTAGLGTGFLAVGTASPYIGTPHRAVIWRGLKRAGHGQALGSLLMNGSHWVLTSAIGIGGSGDIAGTGVYAGHTAAYLLTPPIGCACY